MALSSNRLICFVPGADLQKADGTMGEPAGSPAWLTMWDSVDIRCQDSNPTSMLEPKVLCPVLLSLLSALLLQLRDVCVQDGSVWTQV